MSNKTQLQTNNATLDDFISRINAAKDTAASLPDAGGGSSGNIETCTLTITSPSRASASYYYVDEGFNLVSGNLTMWVATATVTIMKNSIVCVSGNNVSASGAYINIFNTEGGTTFAFFISGDTTITVNSV